ncbi:hypothetical protein [Streptomyces sp. T028]|uniref:hypothetical protein n=1 Tax=Streptomyces sp. T028 TaxID=3394379 RepID=UPI003A8C4C6F
MGESRTPGGPLSWADVCLRKDRLRQRAKESGLLPAWRELDRASREQRDTLREWTALWEAVDAHRVLAGGYVVRTEGEDAASTVAYGCPTARECGRRVIAEPADPAPECRLARQEMAREGR